MTEDLHPLLSKAVSMRKLRISPNVGRWMEEILHILDGSQERTIVEIGSVRQHINRLLVDSKQPTQARNFFNVALDAIVFSWNPVDVAPLYNVRCLELIAAFTPPHGFGKVLGYMVARKLHGIVTNEIDRSQTDICLTGLKALEAYHQAAPQATSEPSFFQYHELLKSYMDDPLYSAHALRRILELRLFSTTDKSHLRIIKGLITNDRVLREFIQYAIGVHRHLLHPWLGPIIAICLEVHDAQSFSDQPYWLFKKFLDVAKEVGATLADEDEYPHDIQVGEDLTIPFLLPPSAYHHYESAMAYESQQLFTQRNPEMIGAGTDDAA